MPACRPGSSSSVRKTVVFDVLGTLFSLDTLRTELRELGAPDHALELWFGQSLRDYFAFSHAGGYVPLKEVLEAGLPRALKTFEREVSADRASAVVGKLTELEPGPGGREACSKLREAGCTLVALSNGSLESTTALLERAGIADDFAAVRSCDEIEVSKPAAATYEMAREVAEGELWMVAAHAWDLAGAQRAGLRTAWLATVEPEYLSAYPPPDLTAGDLAEGAEKLLAE